MPESTKPKSTKAKSTKTKADNPSPTTSKIETAQKTSHVESPSPTTTSFRASPRISGIFTGIREHWQFGLTFVVACVGTWLLLNQNVLLKTQNTLIQHQMSLEEASRRSALIMLMSNIMDKVDREIELQQEGLSKQARDTTQYKLSQSLNGQIAALSHSFKTYRYMSGDSLISHALSPERGHLLMTLTLLPLDSSTFAEIYEKATFKEADLQRSILRDANLRRADLVGANMSNADLFEANLYGAQLIGVNLNAAHLIGANMSWANMSNADLFKAKLAGSNLIKTNLSWTDLRDADLAYADLRGAHLEGSKLSGANLNMADLSMADLSKTELTIKQLSKAGNLYHCKGIQDSISIDLHKTHSIL